MSVQNNIEILEYEIKCLENTKRFKRKHEEINSQIYSLYQELEQLQILDRVKNVNKKYEEKQKDTSQEISGITVDTNEEISSEKPSKSAQVKSSTTKTSRKRGRKKKSLESNTDE